MVHLDTLHTSKETGQINRGADANWRKLIKSDGLNLLGLSYFMWCRITPRYVRALLIAGITRWLPPSRTLMRIIKQHSAMRYESLHNEHNQSDLVHCKKRFFTHCLLSVEVDFFSVVELTAGSMNIYF